MSDQYLSAEALQISHEERAALIKVAEFIGDAPYHARVVFGERLRGTSPMGVHFNMGFAAVAVAHCGTVACLGGHVALMMQDLDPEDLANTATTKEEREVMARYVEQFQVRARRGDQPLAKLYYPGYSPGYGATPEQAAEATRNFLTTGDPQWPTVVPDGDGDRL